MPVTTVQRDIQEFKPDPTTVDRSFQNISPATDPGFKSLLDQILGGIPQPEAAPELQGPEQFLQQLAPLLQIILEPLLARLQKGEESARGGVTDAFRAAGGGKGPSRSTAFGQSTALLESELQGRRGDLLSSITSQTLSPLLQSLLSTQAQEQSSFFKEQELKQAPTDMLTRILQLVAPQLAQSGQTTSGGPGQFLEVGRTTETPNVQTSFAGPGGINRDAPGRASGATNIPSIFGPGGPGSSGRSTGFERGDITPPGSGGISFGAPRSAPAPATGRTLEQIITDSLALNPVIGPQGIFREPGTNNFSGTPGPGNFFPESGGGGIADFNQPDPFGIFDNDFSEGF